MEEIREKLRKDLEFEDGGLWLEGQESSWRGQASLSVSEGLRDSFITKAVELF